MKVELCDQWRVETQVRSAELLFATVQTMDQPKRGRPSDYSAEIADTICDRLAGGESLRAICADAGMPDRATVSRWLARYEEFRGLYGCAREWQAGCLVDKILEIARDSSGDYVEKHLPDGKVVLVVNHENIALAGLRINALKWIVARMAPRKYGKPRS
jgi:hypothetical protein